MLTDILTNPTYAALASSLGTAAAIALGIKLRGAAIKRGDRLRNAAPVKPPSDSN